MTESELHRAIRRTGRRIAMQRAMLVALFAVPTVAAVLWLCGLLDLYLRFGRPMRVVCWLVVVAAAGLGAWLIRRPLSRRHSVEGIAADLERCFPELDNYLINHVQLARRAEADAFCRAYLEEGVRAWESVDPGRVRDRRRERNGWLLAAGVALLLLVPLAMRGPAWPVALWRVANPFSSRAPVSLTRVLGVAPGEATVRQGSPVILECRVTGRPGHRIWLDVNSEGDDPATYDLGVIEERGESIFRHRIPRLTAETRYRFRAGDAVARTWYGLTPKPPLSVNAVDLVVTPPPYTRLEAASFNALVERARIPKGSEVAIRGRCNQRLASARAGQGPGEASDLSIGGDGAEFSGSLRIESGSPITLWATDLQDDRTEVTLVHDFIPDRPPEIIVVFPRERARLTEGTPPRLRFDVRDDYGIAAIRIEPAPVPGRDAGAVDAVASWPGGGRRRLLDTWVDDEPLAGPRDRRAVRVVATDVGEPEQESTSASITFEWASQEDAQATEQDVAAELDNTLSKLIALQTVNVDRTGFLKDRLDKATRDDWVAVTDRQQEVRDIAAELLRDPRKPLGTLSTVVKALYLEDMVEVVALLTRIPKLAPPAAVPPVSKALALEKRILRKLAFTETAAEHTEKKRRIAGVLGMLSRLIKGQTGVRDSTVAIVKQGVEVGQVLVDQQDELAGDVSDFRRACEGDAQDLAGNDASFAELILNVAAEVEARQVKADMLRSAERLETNKAGAAQPFQEKAITNLTACYEMLNAWQIARVDRRVEEMIEALSDTGDRLEKIRRLEGRVIEAMKELNAQADETDQEQDLFEEELNELREQTEEALLQVARDLHTFPELSVANELVEDVYSVFEEVNQVEGSELWGEEMMSELGVLKPEAFLEIMEHAEDHVEAMEQWLSDKPDLMKFEMEPFDAEELPRMALGGLESSIEDLIGDLLEESEELAEAADDSATNQGVPQNEIPGWEVAEGPTESFGAQGKSGNQVPDHKEQSGRSLVGREGQSIGETAAGTGTISEGDKNIENRMTPDPLQSGQVQADGEASENATGGGKQASGAAEETGMSGTVAHSRMDAPVRGSMQGLQSMMAKADSIYVKASLMNVRTESLGRAAHHVRQANDAIASGLPAAQVREYQRRAVVALKEARTSLSAGFVEESMSGPAVNALDDAVEGTISTAPPGYRDLVADYFRALNNDL